MGNETLDSKELKLGFQEHLSTSDNLSQDKVTAFAGRSLSMLEELKPKLSRKLMFYLEEKIQREKQELQQLLGLTENRVAAMDKYSNVLDSQFFEQIFFN